MTKEQYFNMCEMLNSVPKEEEIPVDYSDLPYEVQLAYKIYTLLPDIYEGFSGTYLGKNWSGIDAILKAYEVEQPLICLELISVIDSTRAEYLRDKQKQAQAASKANSKGQSRP